MVVVHDPEDAFPDYTDETRKKVAEHERRLREAGVHFEKREVTLLANDDDILDLCRPIETGCLGETIVLDVTSLPKRFFCFMLKRLCRADAVPNVVATYTGSAGYTSDHLAADPLPPDNLPGFGGPPPPPTPNTTLVLSLGFESLNLASLLDIHSREARDLRFIVPYPPDGQSMQRCWETLYAVLRGVADRARDRIDVVAGWDCEQVYRVLWRLHGDADGLAFAPFGPKPHSMAMALFAIKHDVGLYYTQPRAYHPDYSTGRGSTWAYVVKWDGVPCYERLRQAP